MSNGTKNNVSSTESRYCSTWRFIVSGLCIAIIGAATLSLFECLAAAFTTAKHFQDLAWPKILVLSALGKIAVTHTLFWCPVMVIIAVLYRLGIHRRRQTIPEPFLLALFIVLVCLIVIPADLGLAGLSSSKLVIGSCIAGILLAVGVYAATRYTCRKLNHLRRCRIILAIATVLAGLVIIISGMSFVQSPFFKPGTYQAPLGAAVQSSDSRPNVLWIVLDTVRADRMSCYGYSAKTTPFLEKWADQSIVFDRAFSNAMWTLPSHTSMLTGLSIREHGTDHTNLWLDDSFPTVTNVLAENGYKTALFSNNPWLSPKSNLSKGFDICQVVYHLRHLGRFSLEWIADKFGITPFVPWFDNDFGAGLTAYLVGQWLDSQADGKKPFFLFINYMEAHLPYSVPKQYRQQYMTDKQVDRSYDLHRKVYGSIVSAMDLRFNIEGNDFFAMSDREILKRQYEATLRYLDNRVREVIGMLEQRGLLDNTMVIITSDHGEYLDTHGMWSHRMQLYQDVIHIPLMIRPAGTYEAKRVDSPVLLSDLYGTVLKAVLDKFNTNSAWETQDLLTMPDADSTPGIVISEYGGTSSGTQERIRKCGDPAVVHRAQPQIAAQNGRFKYIASADGLRELYDLKNDHGELSNLFDSNHAQAAQLKEHIDKWRRTVPLYRPTKPKTDMDEATIKVLRSLGYLNH